MANFQRKIEKLSKSEKKFRDLSGIFYNPAFNKSFYKKKKEKFNFKIQNLKFYYKFEILLFISIIQIYLKRKFILFI